MCCSPLVPAAASRASPSGTTAACNRSEQCPVCPRDWWGSPLGRLRPVGRGRVSRGIHFLESSDAPALAPPPRPSPAHAVGYTPHSVCWEDHMAQASQPHHVTAAEAAVI